MSDYFLGGALGGLLASVYAIPAVVMEWRRHANALNTPLVIEVKSVFGIPIRHEREVFLIGLFLHILIGFLFGLMYIVFVEQGWLFITHAPFTALSFVAYAICSWLVAGCVVYPLLGFGWFGRKEGSHVWRETLVSHLLLGGGLWVLIRYFQPAFFS